MLVQISVIAVAMLLGFALLLILIKNGLSSNMDKLERAIREEMRQQREESASIIKDFRTEMQEYQNKNTGTLVQSLGEIGKAQQGQLEDISKRIADLSEKNTDGLNKLKETVDKQLLSLQDRNEKKLEEMRKTVDEKLQSTLEKRLGESFKIVSDNLEAVQRGLGEMKTLATGVGDLKKVLTNVKDRGTWGEFRLEAILEQILSPEQYEKNVQPNPATGQVVEFAIKLPGRDDENSYVWLPIDSKFPREDFIRLVDASDLADQDGIKNSRAALFRTIKQYAKDISSKYVNPPYTTDFAIMFLPTEGLYAEILRDPALVEDLQRNFRVVVSGPTTLAAILNSLQMGFRTLAIEKRSSEVWRILAAVKTEFGKFGDVLSKVKKQIQTAANTIEESEVRTRQMERKLKNVEQMPEKESKDLLGFNPAGELFDEDPPSP